MTTQSLLKSEISRRLVQMKIEENYYLLEMLFIVAKIAASVSGDPQFNCYTATYYPNKYEARQSLCPTSN